MLDAEISLSTWGRLYGLPFQWLIMLITCHNESDEAFDRWENQLQYLPLLYQSPLGVYIRRNNGLLSRCGDFKNLRLGYNPDEDIACEHGECYQLDILLLFDFCHCSGFCRKGVSTLVSCGSEGECRYAWLSKDRFAWTLYNACKKLQTKRLWPFRCTAMVVRGIVFSGDFQRPGCTNQGGELFHTPIAGLFVHPL